MNAKWLIPFVTPLLLAPAAHAQLPPIHVLETSIETVGGNAHLPASVPGSLLVAAACPGCVPQSLRLTATAHYYINGADVALEKLRAAALGRMDAPLTIHIRLKDQVVSRVELTLP